MLRSTIISSLIALLLLALHASGAAAQQAPPDDSALDDSATPADGTSAEDAAPDGPGAASDDAASDDAAADDAAADDAASDDAVADDTASDDAVPPAPPPAPAPPPTGRVTGVVTDHATGVPMAGAEVSLGAARTTTDDEGRFTLEDIPPGAHHLEVLFLGYLPQTAEVRVSAGAAARQDIRLLGDPAFSEVILIVGSRTERTALQTPVPVDLITGETLRQGGTSETNQALSSVAPSYQASHQAVADGSDHVNPASMRGLGPDQVLVLVNGKRRHSSALIHSTDSFGRGTAGVDLNAIPVSAIKRIEVLRDGASAQYGSDAIAGVVNIVLDDDIGTRATATTGLTGSGDGFSVLTGASHGARIGKRGVFNLTAEFLRREPTNRAAAWTGSFYGEDLSYEETTERLAQNGLSRDDVRMRIGQSRATVGSLLFNTRAPLGSLHVYSFGGATFRTGDAAGFYRLPEQEDRVDLGRYPNGFLPEIHTSILDWSLVAGAAAEVAGWKLDLSATHGGNLFLFEIRNSVNASLGAAGGEALGARDGGTTFDAGGQAFLQTLVNADAVRPLTVPGIRKLGLAVGSELRVENFRQIAGEEASYAFGSETTSTGDPKIPGSQVFPGYQPDSEVSAYRTSVGTYLGLESEITRKLLVDVAGRFEHYTDFGSTVTGKLASRLDVIDGVALRGAVSTGFRAPALHQVWFSAISTQFEAIDGMQVPRQALLANNGSELASAFGIPQLKEETSLNMSAGITTRPIQNLSLAVDAYRITIDDRILLSSRFSDSVPGVADLLAGFQGVSQVEFFVNAADTETLGMDLVADYAVPLARGDLQLTAAANFTRTRVKDVHVPPTLAESLGTTDLDVVRDVLFNWQEQNRLEDLLPRRKGSLTARYRRGAMTTLARTRYYGPSRYSGYADDGSEDEEFGDKVVFDVELGYRFRDQWAVAIGADNVLNTFPDQQKHEANRYHDQFRYRPDQFGMNGGFYYLRLQYLH